MKKLSYLAALLAFLIACGGGDANSDLATSSTQKTSISNPTQAAAAATQAAATATQAAATTTQVTATATPTTTATDASVMPNTLQAHNFQILDRHPDPKLDCINDSMDVFIDVFGVVVIATNSAPLPYVVHTAGVLAQFLDNDEDGVPDEPNVLDKLVEIGKIHKIESRNAFIACQNSSCQVSKATAFSICEICEKVTEISSASLSKYLTNFKDKDGMKYSKYNLEFFGLCKKCR